MTGSVPDLQVLVVDGQRLFAEALSRALAEWLSADVVLRDPTNADFSVAAPDLIVADPTINRSFEPKLINTLRTRWTESRLVVVTGDCSETAIVDALAGGVQAYLLKSEPVETLRAAIELVCRGGTAFSLPVCSVICATAVPARHPLALSATPRRGLTAREIQVVQLIARGHTDPEMSALLDVSVRTVERHVSNVLNKLGCRTRSQAVAEVVGGPAPLVDKARAS